MVSAAEGWRLRLLTLVEEVYSGAGGLPHGALRWAFSTLDDLRANGAQPSDLGHVEQLAVRLHQLQAVVGTAGGDSKPARGVRHAIRQIALRWLQDTRVADLAGAYGN